MAHYTKFSMSIDIFSDVVESINGQSGNITLVGGTGISVVTTGSTITVNNTAPGTGTVTSVGLADGSTTPIYSISGSPVTSAGTLTFTLANQNVNRVLAGPSSGSPAQPTFRALVSSDIPALSYVTNVTATSPITSSGGTTPNIALTTVPVTLGGTGLTTLTLNNVILGNGTSTPQFVSPGTSGNVLTSNGTTWTSLPPAVSGTVTSVSVVNANGFAGTVATATTTPAITLSTTITGLLQGNGTAISAYTGGNLTDVGTDGITIGNGTGAVIGSGTTISQHVADTTHNGYLSSTDWNTFNSKITSTLPSGDIFVGNASNIATAVAMSGDATLANTGTLTLATVNSNVGSFGSSTAIPNFTVNAKGLITAAGTSAVIAPAGTLTGTTLASNVVTSSLTTVGTIGTGVWQGTPIGIAFGGTNNSSAYTAGSVIFSNGTSLTQDNAKFFWDDTNFALGIGTNTPSTAAVIDLVNNSGSNKAVQITSYGANNGFRARRATGTLSSPTASLNGDILSFISGRGYGATGFAAGSTGALNMVAGDTFTDSSMPTYMQFMVTHSASVTAVEAARISPASNLLVGTTTDASGLLQVGTSSQFQVTSAGNVAKINNVAYVWPASQAGAAGDVLANDASGNLSWATATSIFGNQSANTLLAGPASGAAAAPTFRAFVVADSLPAQIAYFGDGGDGALSISSGTTTLTRDMYYSSITITSTGKINTGGYRIFCSGTIDLTGAGAGAISVTPVNGQNGAAGGTGGNPGNAGTQSVGSGGNGSTGGAGGAPTANGTIGGAAGLGIGNGGLGGSAGNGGNGSATTGGTGRASSGTNWTTFPVRRFDINQLRGTVLIQGGQGANSGGGGGGDTGTDSGGGGGGGGSGGGVIFISTFNLSVTGAAAGAIRALGALGGNGGTPAGFVVGVGGGGGAAGSGGGYIYIAYGTKTGTATNAVDVTGGTGGNGGNGSGTGTGGNGGGGGAGGGFIYVNINAGTTTYQTGAAVTSGNAASGNTGGTGAAATTSQFNL